MTTSNSSSTAPAISRRTTGHTISSPPSSPPKTKQKSVMTGRASSCRLLPHGWYALIPTILTTIAWLASLFQDGCDYAKLTGPLVEHLTSENVTWVGVGFAQYRTPIYDAATDTWQTNYGGKCFEYSDIFVQQDPAWKAATIFAFLAIVIGGGGALFLWFSTCCIFSRGTWRWTGYEVLLAACFQVLAFLWFGTAMCQHPNSCELFWGSQSDLVAAALWTVAAMMIFAYYPKPHNYSGMDDTASGQHERRISTQPELIVTPADTLGHRQEYEAAQRHRQEQPRESEPLQPGAVEEALAFEGDPSAMLPLSYDDDEEFQPDKDLEVV